MTPYHRVTDDGDLLLVPRHVTVTAVEPVVTGQSVGDAVVGAGVERFDAFPQGGCPQNQGDEDNGDNQPLQAGEPNRCLSLALLSRSVSLRPPSFPSKNCM